MRKKKRNKKTLCLGNIKATTQERKKGKKRKKKEEQTKVCVWDKKGKERRGQKKI